MGSSSSTATVSVNFDQAVGKYLTLELHFAWKRFRLSGCDAELKRFRHGVRIQSRSAETKPWAWQPSRLVWIHSSIGWTNQFSTMFKGTFASGIYNYIYIYAPGPATPPPPPPYGMGPIYWSHMRSSPSPPVVWWGCGTVPLPPLWCGGWVPYTGPI